MKQLTRRGTRRWLPLLLSFLLPLLVSTLCFALKGISPFGDASMLRIDAWAQYFPFLTEFRDTLLTGGSLEHTWSFGMGINMVPVFAYYLSSPFYLLSVLVPEAWLPEFTLVLTVVKLSLAGLFFAVYLRIVYGSSKPVVPFFSLLYALCAWTAGYYWNIIWLDVFALLPLLVAGTVCLLRKGHYRLYTLSLALCFWCNYYLSFCCCVFVLLCFFGYNLCKGCNLRTFLLRFARFALCTLLAFGMAAALLLPTLLGMQHTSSAENASFSLFALALPKYNTSFTFGGFLHYLLQLLGRTLPNTPPTSLGGLPNLFTGLSVLLLAIYALCCKEIGRRERLVNAVLLCFLLLSCLFHVLTYFWHGFHIPNMLPARFSFLFSFVLLGMAYRGYTLLGTFRLRKILLPLLTGLLLIGIGLLYAEELSFGYYSVAVSLLVLLAMLAVFLLCWKRLSLRCLPGFRRIKLAELLLCGLFLAEGFLSMYSGVEGGTSRSNVPTPGEGAYALLESVQAEDPELFYRAEFTDKLYTNGGSFFRYAGVNGFTSSALVNFNRFASALGIRTWPESNSFSYVDSSPLTATLCGIKYLVDTDGTLLNPDYTEVLAEDGDLRLLRNKAYSGIGFMTDGALANYATTESQSDPLAEQAALFAMATGLDEPLYSDYLYEPELSASESCTLEYTDNPTQFRYHVPAGMEKGEFSLSYTMPRGGLLCIATRMQGGDDMHAFVNGEERICVPVTSRGIMTLGSVQKGDDIVLHYRSDEFKDAGISMRMAFFNTEVFDQGLALLQDEVWNLTSVSDTSLRGTVTAKTDGLFFTSIPYESGWTAYVDGKELPLAQTYDPTSDDVKLTDAVISFPLEAGTHSIRLEFRAPGTRVGLILSVCSITAFVALCLLKKSPLFAEHPTQKKETPHE